MAAVVNAIENDCQLCPESAYKMTPDHEMTRFEAFKGLSNDDALNLEKYQHFRNVQSETKKHLLDQSDAPFQKDFLDPISEDFP